MAIIFEGERDIFTALADWIVCPVNCVGVMGNGLAKAFSLRYPDLLGHYRSNCKQSRLSPGILYSYTPKYINGVLGAGKHVLCFPTKDDWRHPSELEYIELGLKCLVQYYSEIGISSIAIPAIGCGQGQLDWLQAVRPLVYRYLDPLPDLQVEICFQ